MQGRKPLTVIFITVFIDLLGFGLVLPLLPLYAERFGATPFIVTSLSASYSFMQFLFVPLWGRLSDRIGRRPVLLVSIAGTSAAYLCMGLAGSLAALFAARILSGIAGANLSAAQAYIADVTRPEDRAKGMGLVGAAFGLGFIFGPFLGGILAEIPVDALPGPLRPEPGGVPFIASSCLALMNLIMAYRWLPESRTVESGTARPGLSWNSLVKALSHPRLGWLIAIVFISTLAFANMESIFVLWGDRILGMHARQAGMLFAYIGVLMVVVQGGLIGPLSRRFGEPRLVLAGSLLTAAGLLGAPLCRSYSALLLVLPALAIGGGLAGPSIQSMISRRTDAADQGGILGLNQSLSSLGRVLGPLWAGFIFSRAGPGAPWVTGGALMLASAALFALFVLRRTGAESPLPSTEKKKRPAASG